MKPKLLIIELWGLGDLVIATPFLRAAAGKYDVTLLAKPYAAELQQCFWPEVHVQPFVAPWTALSGKYRLWQWPWRTFFRLRRELGTQQFAWCASSRWDPRDQMLMVFLGIRQRIGYPRLGSGKLLTQQLGRPRPRSHRYEQWRTLGKALGLSLPNQAPGFKMASAQGVNVVVHTGAARGFCIWPLKHYLQLIMRLRLQGYSVRLLCDPDQSTEWARLGETDARSPRSVTELMALLADAGVFLGNDSGPGHLAALCGVPTFTLFGPHLPEGWSPMHPAAEWIPGRACPYKPCEDYCRFDVHHCLVDVSEPEAWISIERFVKTHCGGALERAPGGSSTAADDML